MTEARRIKCRWCAWSRPAYWTGRNGKPRSGFELLGRHVDDEHPAEAQEIEARLDAEEDAKKPVTRESWA